MIAYIFALKNLNKYKLPLFLMKFLTQVVPCMTSNILDPFY